MCFELETVLFVVAVQVIARTCEVDIPQYANMTASTGQKLKRLLIVISMLAPFNPNLTTLASQVGVGRNNLEDYLAYIEKAGLIAQLRNPGLSINVLSKTEKAYLDNTNILFNLTNSVAEIGTVCETFFYNQMRVNNRVMASALSDFQIGDKTFEIGGKNKGRKQIMEAQEGDIAKDDIEYGYGNVIPLWAFGLNYQG